MGKRLRFFIIFILILSFFILAPILIFYSQGYRFYFDPESGTIKIIQTGGLSLKINPNGASVFLNGEFKEKTGFFSDFVYIGNLKPKKYNIKVEKEKYYSWEKNLEVEEKQVVEAKNILLIPTDLEFKNLANVTKDFWIFSNKEIILKENNNQEWSLKIFDLEKNLKSHLISEKEISSKNPELLDLKFSSDLKKIILKTGLKERIIFFILDLNQYPVKLVSLDFLEPDVEEVEFNPQDSNSLFYFRNGIFFQINISEKKPQLVAEEIITYKIVQNNIYYLKNSGYILKNNLLFNSEKRINDSPLSLKTETKYQIKTNGDYLFILEDETLYYLDPETKILERFFEPVKEIKISPDFRKALFFNEHEIWVLFLEEQKNQPKKEAFSKQLLIRFSEETNDVFWLNSYYLIFNLKGKIKVIEIDDRDKINSYDLFSTEPSPEKLIWDFDNKNLFFLSQEKILFSDKLKYF